MATSLTTPHDRPESASTPWRVRLPFVSTSFASNVRYFALLWPLWWALGIEQLLLPFFVFYEFIRYLIRARWQVRINSAAVAALVLAVWWVVPVYRVDPDFLDIFLKETASVWAQFLMLVLLWNCIQRREEWEKLVDALGVLALYHVIATAIFLSGVWQGQFISLVGRVLPQSMVNASAFFSSISYRGFGFLALPGDVGLFTQRLNALSLTFSSLSMVCLLLLPMMIWRAQMRRGLRRLYYLGLAAGLLVALIYTESRIAYAALLAGTALYIALRLHLLRPANRPLTVALTFIGGAILLILVFLAVDIILRWFQTTFIDLRPGSWSVRAYIYVQTIAMLPEYPITGWGIPIRLPGVRSEYSAGTHSSYLGMLFQHGVVGLMAYLALWITMWRPVVRGLRQYPVRRSTALLWAALASAFLAFNLREVADTWWWDQSVLFVMWLMWGLALTAGRFFNQPQEA